NAGLNANDPFSKAYGDPRSGYHQNQYGFTVGGPVFLPKIYNGRNRLFFFGAFEQLRNRSQDTIHAYVPTDAERTGDFSGWLQPFQGNVITNPDPKALAYLSHFPEPNYTSPISGDFDNWAGTKTNGINGNNYSIRIDYTLSSHDNFYFRFGHDYGTLLSEGGLIPE